MPLFGIPFTAFAFFWLGLASGIGRAAGPGPPGFFVLFGIPFVIVGLGMLTSPFWMFLKALRTAYAITDRRAFTIERGMWGQVMTHRSTAAPDDPDADAARRRLGQPRLPTRASPSGRHGRFIEFGFLAVPDVNEVEDRIRELIARSDPPGGLRRWEMT